MPVKRRILKAFAYIVHQEQLLVFRHVGIPEAGIQVPAGTIMHEMPDAAVLREAYEETGLQGLRIIRFLGETDYDMQPFGRDEIHHRYYYLLECTQTPPLTWEHAEEHQADGSTESIMFQFFWVKLPDGVPNLIAGHDAFLPQAMIL